MALTTGTPPTELRAQLDALVGQTCWGVTTWPGHLSSFSLMFGGERPPPLPFRLKGKKVIRSGTHRLRVWCVWRLDDELQPRTGNGHSCKVTAKALRVLNGQRVVSVTSSAPAWDLRVAFSGGLTMKVFCDSLPVEPRFPQNWELSVFGKTLKVGPGNHWRIEG